MLITVLVTALITARLTWSLAGLFILHMLGDIPVGIGGTLLVLLPEWPVIVWILNGLKTIWNVI